MNKINFNSIADLKRQATVGRYMKGGYYGKHEGEWRKIVSTQSNGVWLYDGKDRSFFEFPKAGNCEIKDGVLKIYEERVKYGNSDLPAKHSWLQQRLKAGLTKPEEVKFYTLKVAEYELGEGDA